MRKSLRRFLREDAILLINQQIYPELQRSMDTLSRHLTTRKLKSVSQAELARVLGVSRSRVYNLFRAGSIRRYIREAGKRDSVLLLIQKSEGKWKRRK